MQCGCRATSVDILNGNKPVCVIHFGIHPGATIPMATEPDLTGRAAKCALCGKAKPSNKMLPFFESRPDQTHDCYYCGCRGFD